MKDDNIVLFDVEARYSRPDSVTYIEDVVFKDSVTYIEDMVSKKFDCKKVRPSFLDEQVDDTPRTFQQNLESLSRWIDKKAQGNFVTFNKIDGTIISLNMHHVDSIKISNVRKLDSDLTDNNLAPWQSSDLEAAERARFSMPPARHGKNDDDETEFDEGVFL